MLLDAPPPPPSRTALILGLCFGAVAGLARGAVAFDVAGVVERRTTPQECPDEGSLEARIAALEAELVAGGRGDEVKESQRLAEQGAPIPWPEGVPDTHRRPAIREAAAIVAKEYAATVGRVDCDEYPCIVSFVATHDRLRDTEVAGWGRRIDQALIGDMDRFARTSALKEAGPVHTVAVPHRELSALERVRVAWRVREQDQQAVADQYVVTEGF